MSLIHLHNYEAFLLDYSEGTLSEAESVQLKAFLLDHPELEIDINDFNLVYLSGENPKIDFKENLKKTESQVPYEELISYLEGKLQLDEKISFEIKLSQDKDLAKDLEDYKKTILLSDHKEIFNSKSSLQKTEDEFLLNNRVLAYLEDQLTSSEKAEFEKEILVNSSLKKEFEIFSKTIVSADHSIIYPTKEELKKEAKIIAFFTMRTLGSIAAAVLLLFGLVLVYNYYSGKKTDPSVLAIKKTSKKISKHVSSVPGKVLASKLIQGSKENEIVSSEKNTTKKISEEVRKKKNSLEFSLKELEKETPELAKEEKPVETKSILAKEDKTEVADIKKFENIDSTVSKKNYLVVAENVSEENDLIELKESSTAGEKKGLWKRAVRLARQANKLGVKSIDGQENSKNNYRLSFNSFSVGKK